MWKLKWFIDLEKEEKWLEEMAKQGYHLESVSFGYTFRLADPEDAKIKIDYREFKKRRDFIDYCALFEDSGWKHIAGIWWSGNQYFKKVNEESEDDIFSDNMSRAGKYKRLSKMYIELAICYLPFFIVLCTNNSINVNAIINPKELYFTPGIWEMTGASFLGAFLFETPFALMRGLSWLFIPVTILLFLFFGYKANKLYEKSKIE